MKTLKLIALGIILSVSGAIHAQVSIHVNIGSPPSWGPAGYSDVDYYYLPDIEVYYDIHTTQFIYFDDGRWIRSRYLPRPYRNYDLYKGYKVVLSNYHGERPYIYFNNHRVKYYKGYRGRPQRHIEHRDDDYRDSDKHENNGHGERKEHRGHGNWKH